MRQLNESESLDELKILAQGIFKIENMTIPMQLIGHLQSI
jgi:hypothetical protein